MTFTKTVTYRGRSAPQSFPISSSNPPLCCFNCSVSCHFLHFQTVPIILLDEDTTTLTQGSKGVKSQTIFFATRQSSVQARIYTKVFRDTNIPPVTLTVSLGNKESCKNRHFFSDPRKYNGELATRSDCKLGDYMQT